MIAAAGHPDVVGPYRLIKAIGAGGSARIDLARIDRAYNFQRHVVIKRPLEHLRDDSRAAASLRREAHLGGLLRHPHLVAVLDAGTHDGYDFLVLEYIHGASLRALMQVETAGRVRSVPLGVALAIIGDVARGLHHAHELVDEHGASLGLVHRDVSPGNILLGFDGSVKLADFGIAKETRVSTLSGSMHGTVTYMAPEQCRGHAFDRRADVFSLGVILYELATATRLFWADNDVASLHKVLSGNIPRPRKVNPQLPTALEDIILSAVAHDPDRRFTTTRALADALEHVASDLGVILGARWIARWVEDVLGARDVPWMLPARPSPLPPAASALDQDSSLVELISTIAPTSENESDDAPSLDFGPSDPGVGEQTERDHALEARRRSRLRRPFVVATALFASIAVAAAAFIVLTGQTLPFLDRADTGQPAARPSVSSDTGQPGQPTTEPSVSSDTGQPTQPATGSSVSSDTGHATPAGQPDTGRSDTGRSDTGQRTRRTSSKAGSKGKPKKITTAPAPAPPSPETAKKEKPQWDPTLLLPSDSGSGTRKR